MNSSACPVYEQIQQLRTDIAMLNKWADALVADATVCPVQEKIRQLRTDLATLSVWVETLVEQGKLKASDEQAVLVNSRITALDSLLGEVGRHVERRGPR